MSEEEEEEKELVSVYERRSEGAMKMERQRRPSFFLSLSTEFEGDIQNNEMSCTTQETATMMISIDRSMSDEDREVIGMVFSPGVISSTISKRSGSGYILHVLA